MSAEEARLAVAALLEPTVLSAAADAELSVHQLDRLVAHSRAVSLRRIAAALEQIAHNTTPRMP